MNWNLLILDNPLSHWLTALGVALAINVIVGVVKWVIIARLSYIAGKTQTELDDSLIAVTRRTKQWLVFFVTLYIGTLYLTLPDKAVMVLKAAATVAAFVQAGLWGNTAIEFWLSRYRKRALEVDASAATSLGALNFLGRTLLWAVLLLVALDNLGIDVTALVAGLGVGGIAVALAVQNILGDLFASLSIIIDKPFVIGDFIIVDSYMGTVEHVGLKTTRIRSLGGEQLVFSNSDLLGTRIRNYKRMYERRIVFSFGVLYQTTPEQLEQIPQMVKEIISGIDKTRFDRAHFAKFGDSSLDFEVVYWMLDPDYALYMDAQQRINLSLVRRFAEAGIDFAYPTRTLFVEGPVRVETAPAQ
ncbi:MAG: mechanosensitive ion channel family protein [Nevskiales bacterium]|nr:mechanosensitive ion channel family protein [Nevskiales bacterium]